MTNNNSKDIQDSIIQRVSAASRISKNYPPKNANHDRFMQACKDLRAQGISMTFLSSIDGYVAF